MDPIGGFFQKYNAIPVGDQGPLWHKAATRAIEGQLATMLEACCADDRDVAAAAFDTLRPDIIAAVRVLKDRPDRKLAYQDLEGILVICDRK